MPSLNEILTRPGTRQKVVADSERVIEEEVSSKGLTGFPIKAAYKIVKAIKPGFVPEVLDGLLEDFASALDPMFQEAQAANKPVDQFMQANAGRAAEALLGITDARAARAKNAAVKTTYEKLRGMAKKQVEAAVPRTSKMIAKYVASA
ncbi:MAG: hypothetical protein SGI86_18780 [Deltaproteobacteria bacterium]|nr:hypothetical protein [Deltaproteobacteria bacterium]